jgi:hypothetical protein
MKLFFQILLLSAASLSIAAVAGEGQKPESVRLTQVDSFPEQYRVAMRAVIGALSADGPKPSEFFAVITSKTKGILEFHLRHQSHPADSRWLGDECGHCRVVSYDTKSGKVLRILAGC